MSESGSFTKSSIQVPPLAIAPLDEPVVFVGVPAGVQALNNRDRMVAQERSSVMIYDLRLVIIMSSS
jgi:hypothetical protein